jgi:hypothetical protein
LFIWPSSFRVVDFLKSDNQKQELPMVAMFVDGSGQNEQSLERTFHGCLLPSFEQTWTPQAILVSDWLQASTLTFVRLSGTSEN